MYIKRLLCVDIRENKIKYVQVGYSLIGKKLRVENYGTKSFPQSILSNGMLPEGEEMVRELTSLLRREKISAKKVLINLSSTQTVLRVVKVPYMSLKDLKDYLDLEIDQYLPINVINNYYDYKVLGLEKEEDKTLMNVLIISLPRPLVNNYLQLFSKVGLLPEIMDVYPNSVSRLFSDLKEMDVMAVDLNENNLDIIIIKKGKLYMCSSVTIESGTDSEETIVSYGNQYSSHFSIQDVMSQSVNYISTYMEFYSSRHFGKKLDALYLLGDFESIIGVKEYMYNKFKINVSIELPEIPGLKTMYNTDVSSLVSRFPCNIGLAMRGVRF